MNELPERIERRYTPEPNTGCWVWVGHFGDVSRDQNAQTLVAYEQARDFRAAQRAALYERIKHVARYEPELSSTALATRFHIDAVTVKRWLVEAEVAR